MNERRNTHPCMEYKQLSTLPNFLKIFFWYQKKMFLRKKTGIENREFGIIQVYISQFPNSWIIYLYMYHKKNLYPWTESAIFCYYPKLLLVKGINNIILGKYI